MRNKSRKLFIASIISAALSLFPYLGSAQDHTNSSETEGQHSENPVSESHVVDSHSQEADAEFDPGSFIIDHIKDSHDWHIITKADGEHVSIPLPVILYSKEKGLTAFLSSNKDLENILL